MGRGKTQIVGQLRKLAASYDDAPPDLEDYTWMSVPRYWEKVAAPNPGGPRKYIVPHHEDRHGGFAFRVGWDEEERVAALWIL